MHRIRLPALLSLALLASCADPPPPLERLAADDFRQSHPLSVGPAVARLQLSSDNAGLSGEDFRRLHEFAIQYVRKGHGTISVTAGAIGRSDAAAQGYALSIAAALLAEGVKPGELSLYLTVNDPLTGPGQAALRFGTSVAYLPECGDWRGQHDTLSDPNFGCAIQRNIGAMVADPRDLERPHTAMVADAAHGDLVMDRLSKGEGTWLFPLSRTLFNPNDATGYGGK